MDRPTLIRTVWPDKYQTDLPDPHGKVKPYQANLCADIEAMFGFAGKRVLEVGGALNRTFVTEDLKVKSWTAIQELSYWETIGRGVDDLGTIDYPSFEAADAKNLGAYQVITAPIERLPESFYESFDLVVSMAAFTFVQQVGPAIDKIYRCLAPGGAFGILAAQIWSSEAGIFYHTITDKMGRTFSSYPIEGHHNPVPKWGHLLMQPTSLYDYLTRYTDIEAAGNIVHEVFFTRRINRYFAEDYARFFTQSPFGRYGKLNTGITQCDLPDLQLQKTLEAHHPGRRNFNTQVFTAYGQRLV
jgi:SAM-dependent methyltransferase